MLTGTAPDCEPHNGRTYPLLRWSVLAVKSKGKGGGRQGCATTGRLMKKVKMDIKTSFFNVLSKVQIGKMFLQE
jgi:hypothetical protein